MKTFKPLETIIHTEIFDQYHIIFKHQQKTLSHGFSDEKYFSLKAEAPKISSLTGKSEP